MYVLCVRSFVTLFEFGTRITMTMFGPYIALGILSSPESGWDDVGTVPYEPPPMFGR